MAGVLERMSPPPRPAEARAPEDPEVGAEVGEAEAAGARGRGVAPRKTRAAASPAAKRIKGRTIYIADDLFERILVGAHRRDKTISEYVVMILERQVPDHRIVKAEAEADAA